FFFQAEDGIRDFHVTGVQTCALPIYTAPFEPLVREGRLHGRGSSEAKGQVMAHVWAVRAHLESTGRGAPAGGESEAARRRRGGEIGRASCRERVEATEDAETANKKNE